MTWTGWTLVNLTKDGSDDLVLDEFTDVGTATSDSWDLSDCTWRHIQVHDFKVSDNGTGQIDHLLEINLSEDNANWNGWQIYQDGEYYCRAIKFRITVYGDAANGQRPKITRGEVTAAPVDSVGWQGAVQSTEASPPASPDPGDRHLVASAGTGGDFVGHENEIATCVAAEDDTWRYTILPEGGVFWHETDHSYEMMDENGNVITCDPRKTIVSTIHRDGDGYNSISPAAGTFAYTIDAAQDNAGYIESATSGISANADYVAFNVGLAIGTYDLVLKSVTSPSCGKIDVLLGATLLVNWDMYSAGLTRNVRKLLQSISVTTAGTYTIYFKINGQNVLSSGFDMYISWFEIFPH